MRRVAALIVGLAILATGAFAVVTRETKSGSDYRVDAIFDTTKGVIPGNFVEIAGARVGKVTGVRLTRGYKARIEMSISTRFADFRDDARCQIRPVALIGEMAVNCDPGSPGRPALRASRGQPPTVPVARTTVPVDFTDLFNIWSAPVSQRLSIVLSTLGIGLAGRGEDLNAIFARSNPTLMLTRRTIRTLDQQRAQLVSFLDSTDHLLGVLAPRRGVIQRFAEEAARVTARTAEHRGALAESVRRLPALLGVTRPALARLDVVAENAAPVLRDLHAGAPSINRLVADVQPLAQAARPALRRLGSAAADGRKQLHKLAPAIAEIRTFAADSKPVAQQLSELFTNLRDRGFVEGIVSFPYYFGAAVARFDKTSHLGTGNFLASGCSSSGTLQDIVRLAQCSANYHPTTTVPPISETRRTARRPASRQPATSATSATPADPAPTTPLSHIVEAPGGPPRQPSPSESLLDYLLK